MKRTFLAKLGRKSHDKTSPNYRFIVHLAGKFLSSFKKYVKCEISNDHFSYNFSTGALFVVSTYKVPLLKDLLSRSGGLFAFILRLLYLGHTLVKRALANRSKEKGLLGQSGASRIQSCSRLPNFSRAWQRLPSFSSCAVIIYCSAS